MSKKPYQIGDTVKIRLTDGAIHIAQIQRIGIPSDGWRMVEVVYNESARNAVAYFPTRDADN